jgi:hypothetical protein
MSDICHMTHGHCRDSLDSYYYVKYITCNDGEGEFKYDIYIYIYVIL